MRHICLFVLSVLIFLPMTSRAAADCPNNLQITDSSKKTHCFDRLAISNAIPSLHSKKLVELVKNYRCFTLAVSTDSKCDAVAISSIGQPQWCINPTSKLLRNDEALTLCQSTGCNCKVVIDTSEIVDAELLYSKTNGVNSEDKLKGTDRDIANNQANFTAVKNEISKPAATKNSNAFALKIQFTEPDSNGLVIINIQTHTNTSSLKINGEEFGPKADGKYTIKKIARVGQDTKFNIAGIDTNGNSDAKTITVSRKLVESKLTYPELNPERINRQPERDAVAVIIGISNYKNLPKADFAKDDAQVFFDYAIRALGVRPGNIKLLMDEQADAEDIYSAFKTWLPARVKSTTDVYVFYSGHGLPTADSTGLYWLPQRANRDFISKTAILLEEINSDIQASKPKSVTIFMDACYSGQARGGETLVAGARPIALKSQPASFPANFTVISASQADQISSSSPDLEHGIFSYYLMLGMEGDADVNKDGKITLEELQAYLSDNVGRHARIMNRQQEPQVIGNAAKVLVGR